MLHFKNREGGDIYIAKYLIQGINDNGEYCYLRLSAGGVLSLRGTAAQNKRIYDGEPIRPACSAMSIPPKEPEVPSFSYLKNWDAVEKWLDNFKKHDRYSEEKDGILFRKF